jgi:hypothetical protein
MRERHVVSRPPSGRLVLYHGLAYSRVNLNDSERSGQPRVPFGAGASISFWGGEHAGYAEGYAGLLVV